MTDTDNFIDDAHSEFGDLTVSENANIPDLSRIAKQQDKIIANLSKMQITLAELNVRHTHMVESMEHSEKRAKEELKELREQINDLSDRLGTMERLIWKAVGATAIAALAIPYLIKVI